MAIQGYVDSFKGLDAVNARIGLLRADFAGMKDLDAIIDKVLRRLILKEGARANIANVKNGNMTIEQFDGWFEPIVRQELGKALGIVRNKAVQRARAAGAKDAASAVLRRQYMDDLKGNINILGNRKRVSFKTRAYEPGTRRVRSVSPRTRKLYEYYGPDRAFILRFLEGGTDDRIARPSGPTGKRSKATYGFRGRIGAKSFFGQSSADMEAVAKQLGTTLVNYVERWVQDVFEND